LEEGIEGFEEGDEGFERRDEGFEGEDDGFELMGNIAEMFREVSAGVWLKAGS
jgi:hypothetical protein